MLGIDAARAVAIIGMVMVHVGPTDTIEPGLASRVYGVSHGRASILFAVLAGIGVSLLAGDRSPERLRSVTLRLAWRTLVLLPLGLVLQELGHGVLVILQYYAVYYVVAAFAARMADRVLLALAVLWTVVGPLLYVGIQVWRPSWAAAAGAATASDPPSQIVRDLLLTGSYPVLTWSAPILFGVWLGRRDLRRPATQAVLVVAGTAVGGAAALVARLAGPGGSTGWGQLVLAEAHSQMPLWIAGATGVAAAVLGACLLLASAAPRVTWPFAAMGQLAFTVYVVHLLVLAVAPDLLGRDTVGAASTSVLRFTIATVALCSAWRLLLPRGPLEVLLRLPWSVRRWLGRRHASG